jgi:hypothetical protein
MSAQAATLARSRPSGPDGLVADFGDFLELPLPILREILAFGHAPVFNDETQAVVQAPLSTQSVFEDSLDVVAFDLLEEFLVDKNLAQILLGVLVPYSCSFEELLGVDVAILIGDQCKQ